MFIAILQLELSIPWARSLKDKRSVVKSLKDKLHREHLVSVAEVGMNEAHRTALVGVALVTNAVPHAREVMQRIVRKIEALPDADLVDHQLDIVRPGDLPEDQLIDEEQDLTGHPCEADAA